MALKVYTVDINGLPHTMQLDEAEAKRLGAKPVEAKKAPAPSNKARTPDNKKA